MTIKIDLQFEGAWKIGFLVEDGKDRVREYLEDLIKRHKHQELKWLLAEMKLFCDRGPHPSKKTFAPEGNGIFAIKSHQQRIYGFFDG